MTLRVHMTQIEHVAYIFDWKAVCVSSEVCLQYVVRAPVAVLTYQV